jgi:hypothetical protein
MTDPIGVMVRIATYLFIQLGWLIGAGIQNFILFIFEPRDRRSKRLIKADNIGKYLSRLRKLHCMIAPTEGFET